jgi:hypothetical protein
MNLIALDFGTVLLLILLLVAISVAYRFVWWLAAVSERAVANLTRTGMSEAAKALLAVLINYDEQTYRKSRFVVWNQATVRFALFWGAFVLLAAVLGLLYEAQVIESVGIAWTLILATYIGFRYVVYITSPKTHLANPEGSGFELDSSNFYVKERNPGSNRNGHQVIRRYDYLDELFG